MITSLPSFPALQKHATTIKKLHMKALFEQDPERFNTFSFDAPHLFLDYSKNLITTEIRDLLCQLVDEVNLSEKRAALFSGKKVGDNNLNNTEDRQVLHTALRLPESLLQSDESLPYLPEKSIRTEVLNCRQKMKCFVDQVHDGSLKGYTGKPFKAMVSIGIGGSFLGPKMVTKALTPFGKPGLRIHYIANIDSTDFYEVMQKVKIDETIFLLQSKSFGTIETLYNGQAVKDHMIHQGLKKDDIAKHFYAVTSNIESATEFGIDEDNIFPMWDWVGGRYSLWSAIGLPIAFLIGSEKFEDFLHGAFDMDQHFLTTEHKSNMPIMLALMGIWYNNFFGTSSHAVLPYNHYLRFLPHHLQQLDMESNGKQVTNAGFRVQSATGSIVWGGEGTNGQHAFHQLLHQGTHLLPCDFLLALNSTHPIGNHHPLLVSNCFSQTRALLEGKTYQQALDELLEQGLDQKEAEKLAPHKVYPGNRPSNTILFDILSPKSIGALIAAYEHKVFVQGLIWGINSFDQWGVELGKSLGKEIFEQLADSNKAVLGDSSTQGLVERYRKAISE